jgi:UDP-N-acetylglucosamine--N-acetylmuramyl-(pentapeptide) pyrophosphoryl-undecaprenol N-acetylglucosamine transferase
MTKTYVIAGGGTGGHIYPGVAVAHALKKQNSACEIVFVGTAAGLETKIVPREGFRLELIEVGKLNDGGGILGKLKVLLRLPVGLFQSYKLLKQLQPAGVLGVGGYASGPFMLVASIMRFPTAIWEANAHPGLTNRWLSRFVRKAYLVFSEAKGLLRSKNLEITGLPVREDIENPPKETTSKTFRILVFGGSQGARAINHTVAEAIEKGGPWLDGVHIVHQTGRLDFSEIQKRYQGRDAVVSVHEFLYDMHVQYANCDLVICRGGASTVTELAACGKVAIVIPLPTAADNHQQKNAETLVKSNAGSMILQKNLTSDSLIAEIERLRTDVELRKSISHNIRKLFIPKAAETMARDLSEGIPI